MPTIDQNIEEKISRDFDESASEYCCRYNEEGLSSSSRILMNSLVEEGMSGKTILDLGCGPGSFIVEALKKGANIGIGIDLSPSMIKAASDLALTIGFEGRAKFELGNAATARLPACDIATIDKVICCYPKASSLLLNAAEVSKDIIAFVAPKDSGIIGSLIRAAAFFANLVGRVRKKSIPFYVHSLKSADRVLRQAGFARRRKIGSRIWVVLLYKRTSSRSP